MRYELRKCCEEDRAWAYALKCEAYREVVERQFGPWNEEFQRELFNGRWNPNISSVVLMNGTPIGLIAVAERIGHVWLDEIQITREWRDRGIGTAIVQEIISRAPVVRLQVLKKNTRAQELYQRLAFRVVGETETHYLMQHGENEKA